MSTNLDVATRTFYDKTWKSQITYGMPLLTRLLERKRFRAGGLWVSNINETADSESLVQEYGPNEGLSAGSKTIMDTAKWNIAYMQVPHEENIDERVMNKPDNDAQLLRILEKTVKSGQRGLKIRMAKRIYGCAGDTEIDDKHTLMQGIPSALDNAVYGGITKSSDTYWYAADYSNNSTSYTISKRQIWEWIDDVKYYAEDPGSIMVVMGSTLFRSLKAEFEAANQYKPKGMTASQGFQSMEIDGYEIAEDPFLDTLTYQSVYDYDGDAACLDGSGTYAGTQFVALLNLDSWVFRYVPAQNSASGEGFIEWQDWFNLAQLPNMPEKWLARSKVKCNLECHQPNINMVRFNVSA